MEKELIKKFAIDLKFKVNDEEIEDIAKEFDSLEEMLKVFEKIDTDGVEEMIYPFDLETSYIREDEESHLLSQDDALKNASKVKQGHFVVPKVVK